MTATERPKTRVLKLRGAQPHATGERSFNGTWMNDKITVVDGHGECVIWVTPRESKKPRASVTGIARGEVDDFLHMLLKVDRVEWSMSEGEELAAFRELAARMRSVLRSLHCYNDVTQLARDFAKLAPDQP